MTRGQLYVARVVLLLASLARVPCSGTGADKDLPAPLKDHDMTCYAENLDYMTCHWPRQGPGVGYQLTFTPQTYRRRKDYNCTVECDTSTCHCYIPPLSVYTYMNHSLVLNATNQAGSTLSNFEREADYPIARSGPVSDLTVVQSSPHSVSLAWKRPRDLSSVFFPDNEISYIVTYDKERNHNRNVSTSRSRVTITNLHPARKYLFHVQSKILGSVYRGNDTIVHGWTKQAEPERSPQLVTYRRDAKCGNKTCLLVFWQPIPLEYQNGEILEYHLDAHPVISTGDNVTVSLSPDTISSAAVFTDLYANMAYKLSIKGCNRAGCSPSHEMILPSLENGPISVPRVYGEATKDRKRVTFNWRPLHEPERLLLTTVLCPTGETSCQSELRTVSVDPVAGHCYMENPEPGHRYGMVTVVNETMGGLAEDWMCIYVEDGVPSRPDFHLQSWDTHSIVVKVQAGECATSMEENVAMPLKFLLTYGEGACNKANSVDLETDGEAIHMIGDLRSGTKYMLCLTALGKFRNSTEVIHTVVTNIDIVPLVVLIVMVVFVVVIIVLTIVMLCIKLKEKLTIYVEKPPHQVLSGLPLKTDWETIGTEEQKTFPNSKEKYHNGYSPAESNSDSGWFSEFGYIGDYSKISNRELV